MAEIKTICCGEVICSSPDVYLNSSTVAGAVIIARRRGLSLAYADLRDISLIWVHLENMDFRCADLRGVDLRWTHLEGADFRGANMDGADLRGAHVQGTKVNYSQLDYTLVTNSIGDFECYMTGLEG